MTSTSMPSSLARGHALDARDAVVHRDQQVGRSLRGEFDDLRASGRSHTRSGWAPGSRSWPASRPQACAGRAGRPRRRWRRRSRSPPRSAGAHRPRSRRRASVAASSTCASAAGAVRPSSESRRSASLVTPRAASARASGPGRPPAASRRATAGSKSRRTKEVIRPVPRQGSDCATASGDRPARVRQCLSRWRPDSTSSNSAFGQRGKAAVDARHRREPRRPVGVQAGPQRIVPHQQRIAVGRGVARAGLARPPRAQRRAGPAGCYGHAARASAATASRCLRRAARDH